MSDKVYSQAEADALIAGAVLAAAALTPECGNGYACKTMNAKYSTYCPNCKTRNAILALNSDAARLALEERLRAERLKISQACIDVAVSCRAEDVAQRLRAIVDDDRAWLAEWEAKLIANTLSAAADGIKSGASAGKYADTVLKAASAYIRSLTPAKIAALAEERDRRVRFEEVQEPSEK